MFIGVVYLSIYLKCYARLATIHNVCKDNPTLEMLETLEMFNG